MRIRRANISEASDLSVFVSELARIHIGPTLHEGGVQKLLDSMNAESTAQRFRDGFPHWIVDDGEQILGVAVVKPPSHVYHLFVTTDRHREGIGRLLLTEALRFISEDQHCTSATVNASLNSIAAYKKFGFREASEILEEGGVRFQPMSQTLSGPTGSPGHNKRMESNG